MSLNILMVSWCVSLPTWQPSLTLGNREIPKAFGIRGTRSTICPYVPCSYPMMLMRRCLFTCMLSPLARTLTASYKVGGIGEGGGGNRTKANYTSSSTVTLYNCSFGRSDCSLCLAADPAYRCVWCSGQNRCVYEALCSNVTSECPPPVITRVSFVTVCPVPLPP